jgi:imidazolonepropionase-like amidohydrolase
MYDGVLVIEGATALVGRELRALPDAVVVVEGDRIVDLGPRGATEIPDGARRVDASGLTLLPGLIDAHVHIGFANPRDVVRGGVTTVRDLGWPPESIWPLVERSRSPDFDGPSILAAGQILTTEGGYPTRAEWAPEGTGLVVPGPPDAAEAVEQQVMSGATVIKVALNPPVGPTLDRATLGAIVYAAHRRHLRVTGHVFGLEELDKALDAGMDELAHMLMSPERIPEATLGRMVDRGMTVVPTLSVRFGADRETAVENLERLRAAGGRVVYGTDLGNEGPEPGIDRREIAALADAGMSGPEIIASATVDSAAYLGLGDRGVIEEGMRADLVAVSGDPLDDPAALHDVRMVWRAGRWVVGPTP